MPSFQLTNSLVTIRSPEGNSNDFGSLGASGSKSIKDIFPNGINFYGNTYTSIRISGDGFLSFGSHDYSSGGFSTSKQGLISVFYGNADTSIPYGVTLTPSQGGNSTGDAGVTYYFDKTNNKILITWNDVGYETNNFTNLNAYQVEIIRKNASDFDVVFRYENVNWAVDEASGTNYARAGFTSGISGQSLELPGSGDQSQMLTLDTRIGNTGVIGLWAYHFRNGIPKPYNSAKSDFDGDGFGDMILYNKGSRDLTVWSMKDGAVDNKKSIQAIGSDWEIVGTGNFDGDSNADVLFRNNSGDLAVWSMKGESRAAAGLYTGLALSADRNADRIAGIGDFNDDGFDDLVVFDASNNLRVVFTDTASTPGAVKAKSDSMIQSSVRSEWSVADVEDYNGDGYADLLWRRNDTGLVGMWLMEGVNRTSAATIQETVKTDWKYAGSGDINGDGAADIIWRNDDGRVATWEMSGLTRTGAGVTNLTMSSTESLSMVSDINSDGVADLISFDSVTGGIKSGAFTNSANRSSLSLTTLGTADSGNLALF